MKLVGGNIKLLYVFLTYVSEASVFLIVLKELKKKIKKEYIFLAQLSNNFYITLIVFKKKIIIEYLRLICEKINIIINYKNKKKLSKLYENYIINFLP